ncbi:MAG TPA: hypothetical protein VGX76_21815, partial [Pirellulales bacterium]|nr:hypothetical protein [Pirellulales bacterium]
SNAPRPAAGEEYENESLPGDVITELKKTNELLQAQLEQQRRDAGERGAADRAAGARATAAVGGGREFG